VTPVLSHDHRHGDQVGAQEAAVTGAWVAVGLLLLGLPLLAWWVGGRRFWARLERLAGSDL
jgi:hypothetical protein